MGAYLLVLTWLHFDSNYFASQNYRVEIWEYKHILKRKNTKNHPGHTIWNWVGIRKILSWVILNVSWSLWFADVFILSVFRRNRLIFDIKLAFISMACSGESLVNMALSFPSIGVCSQSNKVITAYQNLLFVISIIKVKMYHA